MVLAGMAERGEIGKQVIGESIRIGLRQTFFPYHKGGGIMAKKEKKELSKDLLKNMKK